MAIDWEDRWKCLYTEVSVQRLAWRERLSALVLERDRALELEGRSTEYLQYFGAVENLINVIMDIDHILKGIDDDQPVLTVEEDRPDLGWWCIEGVELLYALRKCNRGEDADAVYCELYANCRIEKN